MSSKSEKFLMDPPIQGQYYMHEDAGLYLCRSCKHALFSSEHKFYSGSGYPSFDRAEPGAVKLLESLDRGQGVCCAHCDAFLGRLIQDETFTETRHRYDINSTALQFRPAAKGQ